MSSPSASKSPKALTKKPVARPGKSTAKAAAASAIKRTVAKPRPELPAPSENVEASASALALAKIIETGLINGNGDVISVAAQQALNGALVKLFGGNAEAGHRYPIVRNNSVASTDVMLACSGLLKSANLQVFELGMWQSWTGR